MTIKMNAANDDPLFADFSDEERNMIAVAVRRLEELEEARRITTAMSGQAQAIESDLRSHGITDRDTVREATEAVLATQGAQTSLDSEAQDYRKLLGPEGKALAAIGEYVTLLRNAYAGDVNALNQVQAARRELYEARDAAAANLETSGNEISEGRERYEVQVRDPKTLLVTTVLCTSSAHDAHEAFQGKTDHQIVDNDVGKLVGYQTVTGWKVTREFAGDIAQERTARIGIEASANEMTRIDPERVRPVQIERTEDEKQRLLNTETSVQGQHLTSALPAHFVDRYVRDGNKIVNARDSKHVIMIDKGAKLQLPREFNAESVNAAVDVAEARGWASMHVAGDPKFRHAVWVQAASRGIDVKGYKPTEAEQAWAAKTADKLGKSNSVAENEAVKAFREAKTSSERRAAAAEYPELKKAFAIEANYWKLSKSINGQVAQDSFMKRMRDNIAMDLAQGRELADIRLRKPMFKQAEYARDRNLEQDRGR